MVLILEVLADELGAHDLVVDLDERTIRLIRERNLGDAGHHECVSQAADDGKQREHAQCARCNTLNIQTSTLHNAAEREQHVDELDEYERGNDAAQTPHEQVVGQQLSGRDLTVLNALQRGRNQRDDNERVIDDGRKNRGQRACQAEDVEGVQGPG